MNQEKTLRQWADERGIRLKELSRILKTTPPRTVEGWWQKRRSCPPVALDYLHLREHISEVHALLQEGKNEEALALLNKLNNETT